MVVKSLKNMQRILTLENAYTKGYMIATLHLISASLFGSIKRSSQCCQVQTVRVTASVMQPAWKFKKKSGLFNCVDISDRKL